MHLYFKDDGTLFLRTKTFDSEIDNQYTKKITVPDDFNIYAKTEETDEEGISVKSELSYDEIKAKLTYVEKRSSEYPSVIDQLDSIYHNGVEGWKAEIQKIKDKYPKP